MPIALRLLHWTALLCAFFCAAVYATTFLDRALYGVILFVPLLFVVWPYIVWQWRKIPRANIGSGLFGSIPLWMKVATVVLVVFVFANYLICRQMNLGGIPLRLSDGRLVLQSGEQVMRVLTPAQFAHAQAVQVRLLCGHLVGFYLAAWVALRALWLKTGLAMERARVTGP